MCVLNVQGLMGNRYSKLEDEYMKSLFEKNDILLFTETWLSEMFNADVHGFTSFILNRTEKLKGAKRNSGGLIIYVKSMLKNHVEFVKNVEDCLI